MTGPLVDPQQAAFFASDPSILREQPVEEYQHLDPRTVVEVGVALAAAFVVMHRIMSRDLQDSPPPLHDSKKYIKGLWRRRAPIWLQLATPAVRKGYELGQVTGLTQDELEHMAQSYAEDLGEYISDTSADALIEGFHIQLGAKWSEQLAWKRASAAFGLDASQMRAYVRSTIESTAKDPKFEVLPERARSFINQAILERADRIGGHESWQSMEAGKAIAWLAQKNAGALPVDAQKEWLTAADEKVCPQCGPLNRKRVYLDEKFETPDGNKFWAPGVHPNCRCDLKLIYPEVRDDPFQMVEKVEPGDPYNRKRNGRFARVEERVREPDLVSQSIVSQMQDLANVAEEAIANPLIDSAMANPLVDSPIINPLSDVANPLSTAVANPLGDKPVSTANPLGDKRKRRHTIRQILVMLPGGGYATKNVGAAHEEFDSDEPYSVWMWASQHHENAGAVDQTESDMVPHRVGDEVNFSYDTPRQHFVSVATPYNGDSTSLIDEAEPLYDDVMEWKQPGVEALVNQYHEVWKDFKEQAESNIQANVLSLSNSELRRIFKNAGMRSDTDVNGMRDRLIFTQPDTNLMHSYLEHMEVRYPKDGGEDSPAARLEQIELQLAERGLHFREPTVYIISERHPDTPLMDQHMGTVGMFGKYRVLDSIYRSAELSMGSGRPNNIKGINMVYLEPDDDEPTAEDLRNIEFANDGTPYDRRNPPNWLEEQTKDDAGWTEDEYTEAGFDGPPWEPYRGRIVPYED